MKFIYICIFLSVLILPYIYYNRSINNKNERETSKSHHKETNTKLEINPQITGKPLPEYPKEKISTDSESLWRASFKQMRDLVKNPDIDPFAVWLEIENNEELDESDRSYAYSILAERMFRDGNAKDAISKIYETYGPGRSRSHLLSFAFSGRTKGQGLPLEDLFDIQKNFVTGKDEKDAALSGIRLRILNSGDLSTLNFNKLRDIRPDQLKAMLFGIGSHFRGIKNNPRLTSENLKYIENWIESSIDQGNLPTSSRKDFLMQLAAMNPLKTLEIITKKDVSENDRTEILGRAYSSSIGKNPREGANQLVASGEILDTKVAFMHWAYKDSRDLGDWLDNGNIPHHIKDQAAAALATNVGGDHKSLQNILDSKKWAQQISDQSIQTQTVQYLKNLEAKALVKEAHKAPESTINKIIDANSEYYPSSLGEVFNSYIEKDPSSAEEWYHKNWDTLDAVQTSNLASAYARYAIKHQDLSTAREWAERVVDQDTKTEILKSIATTGVEIQQNP